MLLRTTQHVLGADDSGLFLSGLSTYQATVLRLAPSSLIAYWPQTETSGTTITDVSGNGRNGVYDAVALAQIAGPGPSMGMAPQYNGTSSSGNIFTASLAAAFNNTKGSYGTWIKPTTSAVWTDATARFFLSLGDGTLNNRYEIVSVGTGNVQAQTVRSGTLSSRSLAISGNAWVFFGMTWDTTANQLIAYLDLTATASVTIGGAWSASITVARLGRAQNSAAFYWSGYLAHSTIWSVALSAAQMTVLATAK